MQAGYKPEKIESKHTLCTFQNEGSFSLKGTAFERGLFMQVGLEGRILHRGSSQIIQEVYKGSLEGESLRVSLPVLRSGACPKDFHKTYENSNCINETSECSVDNIFRRHVISGKLIGENYDGKGHIDFYIATSRVCDKLSEVDSDTMPSNSILSGGNRLNHYDHISSFAEEGTNYSAMQRYIEPIRRFLKAVNSTDRPALVNSNSYSSSISSVPSFATPTNFRTSGETEFTCTHNPVRRNEGGNSVVDRKFDVVPGESNNISTSQLVITSDASIQGWGAACQGQTTGGPWTLEEQKNHINILELKAAQLAILTFTYMHPQVHSIHLQTDNMVALSYIVKMGETHNKVLSDISKEIWDYLLSKGITITVEHLPGVLNQEADLQSRLKGDSSEWKLKPNVFQALCKRTWTPAIDLFASRVSNQVPCYYSWKLDPFSKGRDAF